MFVNAGGGGVSVERKHFSRIPTLEIIVWRYVYLVGTIDTHNIEPQ